MAKDRFIMSFFPSAPRSKQFFKFSDKPARMANYGCQEAFILHCVKEVNRGYRVLTRVGCIPSLFCRLAGVRDLIYRSWLSACAGFTQLARTGQVFLDGSTKMDCIVLCQKGKKARSKPRFTTFHNECGILEANVIQVLSGSYLDDARFAYRLARMS